MRSSNGEDTGFGGGAGEDKLSDPKASSIPPNADGGAGDCCGCGCGCGVGFGADAYNERILCFKSGRAAGCVFPALINEALEGRGGGAALEVPKKSSPSRESAGLVAFGGAAPAFGGGCVPTGGPVLGLAGADISSPNKSITGAAFGCETILVDACACLRELDRSSFARSWTTFRGWTS